MIYRLLSALSVFVFCLLLLGSCSLNPKAYSFFVAGHVYGSPSDTLPGLHPPFVADFGYIKSVEYMKLGFFTGDIVYHSRPVYWDSVDQAIAKLNLPIYFAVGNHDEGHKSPYRDRYGKTYQKFESEGDLFLILNPGLGGWNIWKDQMVFLKSALNKAKKYKNIFVFFHQVLWWSPDGKYRTIQINSLDGRSPEINFWSEVEPLFRATGRPVYLFAGDIGANAQKTAFFYDQYENITLLASGMGNISQDNYLIVNVDVNKKVSLMVRWIQQKQIKLIGLD